MAAKRKQRALENSVGLLQRLCKGYLVNKRYFKERAKISINASLMEFTLQRNFWGMLLSN